MAQTSDLIMTIDEFVVELEDQGIPFQEILTELIEYVEICKDLDA